jgi:hypothetical protein
MKHVGVIAVPSFDCHKRYGYGIQPAITLLDSV